MLSLSDLTSRIIEETHLKPSLVRLVLKLLIHDIRQEITDGEEVELDGLCKFVQQNAGSRIQTQFVGAAKSAAAPNRKSLLPAHRVCKVKLDVKLNEYIKRSTQYLTDKDRELLAQDPDLILTTRSTNNSYGAESMGVEFTGLRNVRRQQRHYINVEANKEKNLQSNLEYLRKLNDERYTTSPRPCTPDQ